MHDFFTRFANTKIYVWKKPHGYGLKCHRVIKSICEMVGIKDLYAKVEGGDAVQAVAQAFILGLLRQVYARRTLHFEVFTDNLYNDFVQKSFKELSEETGMHVVEMSPQHNYFPKVLSSPENPVYSAEDTPNFNLVSLWFRLPRIVYLHIFELIKYFSVLQYVYDNKVFHFKKKWPPHWTRDRRYPIMVRKLEKVRSHFDVSI